MRSALQQRVQIRVTRRGREATGCADPPAHLLGTPLGPAARTNPIADHRQLVDLVF